MTEKSRKSSKEFCAADLEYRARDLVLARRAAGASWRELGELCGVSPSWFGKWLEGGHEPGLWKIGRVINGLEGDAPASTGSGG